MSLEHSPTRTANSLQVGPETKELFLLRADEEYNNGNIENSIYYQVKSLYHIGDSRYAYEPELMEPNDLSTAAIMEKFNKEEQEDFKKNVFMQFVVNFLNEMELKEKIKEKRTTATNNDNIVRLDFLESYPNAVDGFKHIKHVCSQLPEEWTIVQFCKSFNPATSYSVFKEIQEADGAIYMTLLRHCRSPKYPPICLRLHSADMSKLFQNYAITIEHFREIINVDPRECKTSKQRENYWKELREFEVFLEESCINELKRQIMPWLFLLKGKHYQQQPVVVQVRERVLKRIDDFCNEHNWDAYRRVVLSQAALHVTQIKKDTLRTVCAEITTNSVEAELAYSIVYNCRTDWQAIKQNEQQRYPCILIIDERLDHMHWEQLDTMQEFTRVKSLHCLWRIFNYHKTRIKNGYYQVDIKQGHCVVNPEGNLPNSGRRLRGFFDYWLPNWSSCYEKKPTESDLINDAYKKDCFIYAGHGSGLQYISGKQIAKTLINSIVFLFGCDSTRMLANGLFSGMIGTHSYYHGAMCPTVIGTLMPALDLNMDCVAVHMLSAWIAPTSSDVVPWSEVDISTWKKSGEVKPKNRKGENVPTLKTLPDYHTGSLCKILNRVHMREIDTTFYNSCVYVCRGLPPWNINVEPFPN